VRTLIIQPADQETAVHSILPLPVVRKNVPDEAAYLRKILSGLHSKGYVLASADSIHRSDDTTVVWLHTGDLFRWVFLRPGNVPEALLREAGYKERMVKDKPFSGNQMARLTESILTQSENRGYPFAMVRLDSLNITGSGISAQLLYSPGPYIIFDSLEIRGSARVKPRFMETYLRIQKGQPYSEAGLQRGLRRLRQLPYLTIRQPYTVTLRNDRAYPVFYADHRPSNVVDGIIGLQPNEQEANKLLITGQLNLQLRNLFSSGKSLSLQWQQIRRASPRLDIAWEHPAFLRTPLTVKAGFSLLKEDSTFLNINQQLGLTYPLNNGSLQTWVRLRSSRLGAGTVAPAEGFSSLGDTRLVTYGAGYEWNNLDDVFYPMRGAVVQISAEAGNKTVLKNTALPAEFYEGIIISSPQFSLLGEVKKFTAVSRRSTLLTQARGGKLINQNLFLNELFRPGGLNSLRGFNENFFFASEYAIGTLEYRYFMEADSYLFLFYDQGWLKHNLRGSYFEDSPSGFGTGLSLTTKAGVFNFVYAIGNTKERPFGLNFSKIHFGYVSRF
jgi:outer membrane protein assembly factor BamA